MRDNKGTHNPAHHDPNPKMQAVLDRAEDLRLAWALTPEAWAEEKYAPLLKAFTELWRVMEDLRCDTTPTTTSR